MGKKKKFIDKKKSATFQLLARDTSDPCYSAGPSGDRVFVRVDNNPYTPNSFFEDGFDEQNGEFSGQNDPNSIFADAPEDEDDFGGDVSRKKALPDHIRREILELGFPDDGYNYLLHLREIKNTGGGSVYYQNPKANLDELPRDIKVYDASRVEVSRIDDNDPNEKSMYKVASRTVDVRVQRALDPEVAALLDDSSSSKFDSDVDDLEEDFVVNANLPEGPVDLGVEKKLSLVDESKVVRLAKKESEISDPLENKPNITRLEKENHRVRRPLDEQFDLLELQEYGTDSEEEEYGGYMDEEDECQESLAEKLKQAFKDHPVKELELNTESQEASADVIQKCREYAEKYENESPNEALVVVEESSDESEVWDCETIITTYSNLDNHPGKIEAPGARRKKKVSTIPEIQGAPNNMISLKGKEKLPIDYLPHGRKNIKEKTKEDGNILKTEQLKRKQHDQESKEEKKERKAAVKEERREARRTKKEMKGLYRCEAQRAQRIAAFSGPASIHLM